MPWSEAAGPSAPDSRFITRDPFDQRLFTEIKRFVVVRNRPGYLLAVPIHTYRGRAGEKWNGRPQDLCLVFPTDTNRNWDRRLLMQREIPIVVEDPDITIDYPDARINFGKIYTVEDYVKVRPIGFVDKDAIPLLEQCFRESLEMNLRKQLDCTDYNIGWICTRRLELLAARLMLDDTHEPPQIDPTEDYNEYIFGTVEGHRVVIACLPLNDKREIPTESMLRTFCNIEYVLLVGIGSGVPPYPSTDTLEDIRLGDVVVGRVQNRNSPLVNLDLKEQGSHSKMKWEFGEKLPFVESTPRPKGNLLSAVDAVDSDHDQMQTQFVKHLARLKTHSQFARPSIESDRLFAADYEHVGDPKSRCASCDKNKLIERTPRTDRTFVIHQGLIASGTGFAPNGRMREKIKQTDDRILCIETKMASITTFLPYLVIRGIADYADTHSNDEWNFYAAGAAAAFAREYLRQVPPRHVIPSKINRNLLVEWTLNEIGIGPVLIPVTRNENFVGRQREMSMLKENLTSNSVCQRVALFGLGGVGKSQIAIEYAYQWKEQNPNCSIFWVSARNRETLEHGYIQIGNLLQLGDGAEDNRSVVPLVKKRLSRENSEQWLLIIDNVDTFDDTNQLHDLPSSPRGSIIFTTRTRKSAMRYAGTGSIIEVKQMERDEAYRVLENYIPEIELSKESVAAYELLSLLGNLPLAIDQAAAFMKHNDIAVSRYLQLYKEQEMQILGEEVGGSGRYLNTKSSVLTNWDVSFESLQVNEKEAADILCFMACVAQENIPESLLPPRSELSATKAIGTLMSYSFIWRRKGEGEEPRFYDMHRLIRLAVQAWLKKKNKLSGWIEKVLVRLNSLIPQDDQNDPETWIAYLPHAISLCNMATLSKDLNPSRIDLLDRIGRCQASIEQYAEAEKTHRQVLELREKLLGKGSPGALKSMCNLALALEKQGKDVDAENIRRELAAVNRKVEAEKSSTPGNILDLIPSTGQIYHTEMTSLGPDVVTSIMEKVRRGHSGGLAKSYGTIRKRETDFVEEILREMVAQEPEELGTKGVEAIKGWLQLTENQGTSRIEKMYNSLGRFLTEVRNLYSSSARKGKIVELDADSDANERGTQDGDDDDLVEVVRR